MRKSLGNNESFAKRQNSTSTVYGNPQGIITVLSKNSKIHYVLKGGYGETQRILRKIRQGKATTSNHEADAVKSHLRKCMVILRK